MEPQDHNDLRAQIEALEAQYRRTAEDALAINTSLKQTQAALDPERLKTTVAQVRRWAEEETHSNWFLAAYADLAQRLTRVEDRLDEIADSLRMILGQLAALERQDREI